MDYDQSRIAATYDEARALTPARRQHWQRLLSAHVDCTAISLIVDLGCGTGRFSEMLAAEFSARVIGLEAIDVIRKSVEQASRFSEMFNDLGELNGGNARRAPAHLLCIPVKADVKSQTGVVMYWN